MMEASKALTTHGESSERNDHVAARTTQILRPVQSCLFTGPFVIRPMLPMQPALRQWENIIG